MKNYFDLTGQVAVVTGASAGLGLQMAKAFANQGANLVLLARRLNLLEENAKAIHEEFGVEVLPVACDITNTEMVQASGKVEVKKAIPMGNTVGIYINTKGILVIDTGEVTGMNGKNSAPAKNKLMQGDYIVGLNGEAMKTKKQLVERILAFIVGIRERVFATCTSYCIYLVDKYYARCFFFGIFK